MCKNTTHRAGSWSRLGLGLQILNQYLSSLFLKQLTDGAEITCSGRLFHISPPLYSGTKNASSLLNLHYCLCNSKLWLLRDPSVLSTYIGLFGESSCTVCCLMISPKASYCTVGVRFDGLSLSSLYSMKSHQPAVQRTVSAGFRDTQTALRHGLHWPSAKKCKFFS